MRAFRKQTFLKVTFALIVLLIIGQIIGSLTIRYLFIQSQIHELFPQLRNIAEDIASTGETHIRNGSFIVKTYDLKLEDSSSEANKNTNLETLDEVLKQELTPDIEKVLAGEDVKTLRQLEAFPQTSIILGTPVYQSGQIVGAVFLLKPASDYNAALYSFYLVFFGVTFISGGIILFVLRLYLLNHEKLEQTRREYVANVSHELRSPISSVKALSETLCDDLIADEQAKKRYYHIIRNESFRLERLINDMLELSRLQNSKVALEKSAFDGQCLSDEITVKYPLLAEDMGLELIVQKNVNTLPKLYSNCDRIIQVITILMDNAFKFCGEEGTVKIDCQINHKFITFHIKNSGTIIEKKDIPFIFERFYKSTQSYNAQGSGLGLAIAKEILTALGENIYVSSEQGKGTVFSFTIRRAL